MGHPPSSTWFLSYGKSGTVNVDAPTLMTLMVFCSSLVVVCVNGLPGRRIESMEIPHSMHVHGACPIGDGFHECADGSGCVRPDMVCDGVAQCADSSDEKAGQCSRDCSSCLPPGQCQRTPRGPMCRRCPLGSRLNAKDNRTCIEIDPCAYDPPICSQLCVKNRTSFSCSCVAGYQLSSDKTHCTAAAWKLEGPYLVYAVYDRVIKVSVKRGSAALPSMVHHARGLIGAIAIDTSNELVYYYDDSDKSINSVDLDGTNQRRVVSSGLSQVTAMAYDWAAKNLYILDAGVSKVIVCSLNVRSMQLSNTVCTSLTITTSGILRSITLDPFLRKIYWSTCSDEAAGRKIFAANMDGTGVETLVSDRLGCPTNLRMDLPLQTLYWVEPELHLIQSVRVDGSNRKNVTSKYISHPVSVDIFEEDLFWSSVFTEDSDNHMTFIASANKFMTDDFDPVQVIPFSDAVPIEMHVFHASIQMPFETSCDRAHCPGVCMSAHNSAITCACGVGQVLAGNQHHCEDSWSHSSLLVANKERVLRVIPDAIGTRSYEIFKSFDANVSAIAVDYDEQIIFVATSSGFGSKASGQIIRITVNIVGKKEVIVNNVGLVRSISVDWISRNIYWADSAKRTVEVSRLNGNFRTVLLGGSGGSPLPEEVGPIAVDPIQRSLYYSDCSPLSPHIGICDLAAINCRTSAFSVPVGCVTSLVVSQRDQRVIWTDAKRGVVSSANTYGEQIRLLRLSPWPLSAAVIGDVVYWTDEHLLDLLSHETKHPDHREKLGMTVGHLGALAAFDKDSQPSGNNPCGRYNGGCSHLCVPSSSSSGDVTCLCPSPMYLEVDKRTCVTEVDFPTQRIGSSDKSNVWMQTSSMPRRAFVTEKRSNGPCNGYCLNGGSCYVHHGVPYCRCVPPMTSDRCEKNSTIASASDDSLPADEEDETESKAWVAGLIFGIIVVVLLLVLTPVCLYRQGFISSVWIVQMKAEFFGRRSDKDHKTVLVSPTYENPGYLDINEGEDMYVKSARSSATPSAPQLTSKSLSQVSLDSAYISGSREYPNIKRMETNTGGQ